MRCLMLWLRRRLQRRVLQRLSIKFGFIGQTPFNFLSDPRMQDLAPEVLHFFYIVFSQSKIDSLFINSYMIFLCGMCIMQHLIINSFGVDENKRSNFANQFIAFQ